MATLERTSGRSVTAREGSAYLLWAAVLLAVLGGLAAVAWYAAPEADWVALGSVADYPPTAAPYRVAADNEFYFIVNDGSNLLVLDPTSPHTQCRVVWVPNDARFVDPCCGGAFTLYGEWIRGPADHGLFRFESEVRDGVLWVNRWTRQPGPRVGEIADD